MEPAEDYFIPPYNPTITRENESKALSDLSRDFDTGGTPAAAARFTIVKKCAIIKMLTESVTGDGVS